MKYIRTKDGRILKYDYVMPFQVELKIKEGFTEEQVLQELEEKSDTIKQADTIEELIDLYVIVTEDGRHITMSVDKAVADLEDNYLRKYYFIKGDYVIYGAIYTDKGLIYVVKMNEKGELELL